MQESLEPRLPHLGEHDGRTVLRAIFLDGEYDLVSQIAAERLQLANHVGELGTLTALLFFPPIAQRRALLQPFLEKLAGSAPSSRQIGTRAVARRRTRTVGGKT